MDLKELSQSYSIIILLRACSLCEKQKVPYVNYAYLTQKDSILNTVNKMFVFHSISFYNANTSYLPTWKSQDCFLIPEDLQHVVENSQRLWPLTIYKSN